MRDAKLRRELSIPAGMPIEDLGTVELLANTQKVIRCGVGKEVTVTAYGMTNDMLQISVGYTYEHQPLAGETAQPFARPATNMCKPDKECARLYYTDSAGQCAIVMKPKLIKR